MTHAALDAIMEEIHKDLYYFTKFGAHRVMVEDHFSKLQKAITAALDDEFAAGKQSARLDAASVKVGKCRS